MDSLDSAVCWARYNADFPSSGFGNGTVGKVGSGSKCRKTIKGNYVGTFHFKFIVHLKQCSKLLKHTYVFAPSHERQVEIQSGLFAVGYYIDAGSELVLQGDGNRIVN